MELHELYVLISIIDTCAERGAFKGSEMISVGTIRDSLVNKVKLHEKEEKKVTIDKS